MLMLQYNQQERRIGKLSNHHTWSWETRILINKVNNNVNGIRNRVFTNKPRNAWSRKDRNDGTGRY